MRLAEVRDWLKTKVDCPSWYIGKLDGKKPECIGLYGLPGGSPNIAIGGLPNTSYTSKLVSILVHWGRNADTAERKAQEVYDALFGQQPTIGDKRVIMFKMSTPEPVNVGTDDEGIYEYVIEMTIFYER
ncbi:hypothetical protein DFQ01_12183 [Paenibacillus cellulosilyticus]|uniref:Minor capsid protein n=1 Tax=Paenibacillus cellulosilyticus TaxID=375489 RepID=A0A2V2YP70_9BACL|nr:minor capsid protein [Paenibacillus cellulosilyticus]PWV97439.1 hypothetical protein DFQ01_12183 [Paenibacillus cellulosilyticus]QKS48522.1 hypothetical protein HUB94_30270 [Paenibacillus cellulosilyticus]